MVFVLLRFGHMVIPETIALLFGIFLMHSGLQQNRTYSLQKLKDVFVIYPYIELGVFNSDELTKNGVSVANAQGGNRDSIVEWVMYMILSLFRRFSQRVRATESFPFELQESLRDKKVLIVGHGSIGSQISTKQRDAYYIKTRACSNKSVDEFTRTNNSILLNPIIARDSKEQNLIIAPSHKEMKAMSKGLQEFGGKVRLICAESFKANQIHKIQNPRIREFLEKVPLNDLLESLQKMNVNCNSDK